MHHLFITIFIIEVFMINCFLMVSLLHPLSGVSVVSCLSIIMLLLG